MIWQGNGKAMWVNNEKGLKRSLWMRMKLPMAQTLGLLSQGELL
jgi:hypothetical protein